MNVELYSDDCKVVASGSFILKTNSSNAMVHIDLRPEYNFWLDLIWTFVMNDSEEDVSVKIGKAEENLLEYVVTNGKFLFGNGTMEPGTVAEFSDGSVLKCNYFFNRPTDKNPRLFTYTLYMERQGE